MTVYSINSTDKEEVKGWADISPTLHPQQRLLTLALSAWKLASKLADEDEPDWERIASIQESAQTIEDLARSSGECSCFLPEQSCEVCRALARLVYNGEFNGT